MVAQGGFVVPKPRDPDNKSSPSDLKSNEDESHDAYTIESTFA